MWNHQNYIIHISWYLGRKSVYQLDAGRWWRKREGSSSTKQVSHSFRDHACDVDAGKVSTCLRCCAGTRSQDSRGCICAGVTLLRGLPPAAVGRDHHAAGGELPCEVQADISAFRRPGAPAHMHGPLPRVLQALS